MAGHRKIVPVKRGKACDLVADARGWVNDATTYPAGEDRMGRIAGDILENVQRLLKQGDLELCFDGRRRVVLVPDRAV